MFTLKQAVELGGDAMARGAGVVDLGFGDGAHHGGWCVLGDAFLRL